MKTILVPVDFSATSENAVKYAIGLAKYTGAKLLLAHAYSIPVMTSEIPQAPIISYDELEEENNRRMESLKLEIIKKEPMLTIEYIVIAGFPVEGINELAEKENPDFIVMGIKNLSKTEEIIIGSTSVNVAKKNKGAVLIVPEGAEFKIPKRIALACDYKEDFSDAVFLKALRKFINLFGATLHIVNVVSPGKEADSNIAITGIKLENYLDRIPHFLHFPEGDDVIESLNTVIKDNDIDLLITLPHKYNFFEKMFHRSNTKKIALHTQVPLLALHAK